MRWYQVSHVDNRARWLADDHYSRQTPGAVEFTPPGNKVVLIVPHPDNPLRRPLAVWASQRPDPISGIGRSDGFDYWNNVIFRNESDLRSSDLIIQALAATKHVWNDVLPADGFHTFVDPAKVRGELVHGFCFMKAGFELHPESTKRRQLLRWIYSADKLAQLSAQEPQTFEDKAVQMALFETA